MAGNHCDDDLPPGGPSGASAAGWFDGQAPRLLGTTQWVESFDELHQHVSALLDSWASAQAEALMSDVYALLDGGDPHAR